jgi:hypothetical protein
MKRIIQGLTFAALISGAPAVWSEWNFNDADAGASIPARSTYADRHAGEPVQLIGFAWLPKGEAFLGIPAQSNYAYRHAGEPVQLYGFGSLVDADAGVSLPTQSTYADRFATDRARVASSASTQAALSE